MLMKRMMMLTELLLVSSFSSASQLSINCHYWGISFFGSESLPVEIFYDPAEFGLRDLGFFSRG